MKFKLSIIQPSRNNLKYLKWSYNSLRKNLSHTEHEICVADDFSDDGTSEWCEETSRNDPYFKYIRNNGPDRLGHTILYDKLINEVATNDVVMIYHADMYACPNFDKYIEKYIKPKTVVSLTRIEPPLHPQGPEKILQNFGQEPDEFDKYEESFLKWFVDSAYHRKNVTTEGIFAPWAIYKSDFQSINGHDVLYAPQSKEDSVTGDRNVIYIENDEIKINSIELLFEKYIDLVETTVDGKEIINFEKHNIKIKSATAESNGEIGKNNINKILRTKTDKKLFKIRTNWGETVCTEDHSLLTKELYKVKPKDLIAGDIWEPIKLKDWTRRTIKSELNFDEINLTIRDIDCYGNNTDLIKLCEFLGFYVAEGSVTNKTISISNKNTDILERMKENSEEILSVKYNNLVEDKKEDYDSVYVYRFLDSAVAKFISEQCGIGSENKKVPDFILNLPKCYQESFLYGYLLGDGYLGTSINRQNNNESFSVDKRLLFHKNIFPKLNWKSTSKSALLTCGINYLLRKNFNVKTNIYFAKDKGNDGVYNISTCSFYKKDILEITEIENIGQYVYDLEINRSHTFIDAMGLFGLHNSDIFNRFLLNDYKFIQTWEGCVYHLTCRGSRYNPTITDIGSDSKEWSSQNIKSSRNFIRKWGHFVKHTPSLKPIVPNRYDIGLVIHNCTPQHLGMLEPYVDTIYTNLDYSNYLYTEQPNTKFDLSKKLKSLYDIKSNDIIIEFDALKLTNNSSQLFNMLPDMLQDSGRVGSMTYDIFKFTINKLHDYKNDLIHINNDWYKNKLL
jgi:hypothetical protein